MTRLPQMPRILATVIAALLVSCGGGSGGDGGGMNNPPPVSDHFFESPTRLQTSLSFDKVGEGVSHSCMLTGAGDAYCWGSNENGKLGTTSATQMCSGGTVPCTPTPMRVAGNVAFNAIDGSSRHTCALASGQSSGGGTEFGLEWPGDGAVRRMLVWTNPFPIYDATYIVKVFPRKKTVAQHGDFLYWTTLFWGNDGAFSWQNGFPNTYYGFHPYPEPAPTGAQQWEISVNSNDYLNGTEVQWDRWYTQAFRAWRESPSITHHEFYYDWPNQNAKIERTIDNPNWGKQDPPIPIISMGQSAWLSYAGDEEFNGVIRGIQIYHGLLSLTEIQSELDQPLSTTAGQNLAWYVNVNPRPSDVTDKKGVGTPHNPTWRNSPAMEWSDGGGGGAPSADAGSAWCWGFGTGGQLGDGQSTSRSQPVAVTGGLTFSQIDVGIGGLITCGIAADTQTYCWGPGDQGGLGNGTTDGADHPVPVATSLRFTTIAVGQNHACGLVANGDAYCWGRNAFGKLGTGTSGSQLSPALVAGGLHFRAITAGGDHSCALTDTNLAWCWGFGLALGNGSNVESNVPVAVSGGRTFASLHAGFNHTCGLTSTGEAFCWGAGTDGIGDGTQTDRLEPVAVAGNLRFRELAAGGATCGITTDNRYFCWGSNLWGAVGQPDMDP